MNREERAELQMNQGPIQNVRRIIGLEDVIDEVLALNELEVDRMRSLLAATLHTGLRARVADGLTSEQRRELLIQGDPESVIADKVRTVTDHTGQAFSV